MMAPWLAAGAMVLDAIIGDPPRLYRRLPHPVDLMARMLMAMEARWNQPLDSPGHQKAWGVITLAVALAASWGLAATLQWLIFALLTPVLGIPLLMLLASSLLAANGLVRHVRAVEIPLRAGDREAARAALSHIVGRETEKLGDSDIAGAALESLAENFSDAVVAPLFWFLVLGFPGLVAYKMVNTADSLIGHRTLRHRHFGWAAARFDDLVNWIPARLSALILALANPFRCGEALAMARQCGPYHLSVNAGWPEAALAGSLDIRIGGPRYYGAIPVGGAEMGYGRPILDAHDIKRGIRLVKAAWLLCLVLTLLVALIGLTPWSR